VEHLDDNAASEFVSGTVSPVAAGRIEAHLASCRDCRALVAALAVDPGDDSSSPTRQRQLSLPPPGPGRRAPSSGDRVGRYLVLSTLGVGGMGVVFTAWDPHLGRKIALKLVRSTVAMSSGDGHARLRREAQAIAQLSHPNVVSIYDVGTTEDGALYIAMEFVEGETLTSWLRSYPRTWPEILDVFRQAARGLIAAHSVGLLHRDFKPDNVLVGGEGRVRVTDFGLARSVLLPDEVSQASPFPWSAAARGGGAPDRLPFAALGVSLTATGTVLGTPRYMPPEQLTGADLDARSDQFSFCVALYEALYGEHPLRGHTAAAMLDDGEGAMPPPDGTRVPPAIGRAVLRGLERDRARRFPSMSALVGELDVRPRRARPRYIALAAVASLAVGGATAAVLSPPRPPAAAQSAVVPVAKVINRNLEHTIEVLTGELQATQVELAVLRKERAEAKVKDAQKDIAIERLTGEVLQLQDKLHVAQKQTTHLVRTAPAVDSQDPALVAIRGCFLEWNERHRDDREWVDATIVVGVTITPDGKGMEPRIVRTPDDHPIVPLDSAGPALSALEHCVSDQVVRLGFAHAPETIECEIILRWSEGKVKLSSSIIGRREVPRRRIELP